jgi:stage V sporulation protein R
LQKQVNELWNTLPNKIKSKDKKKLKLSKICKDPQENLMYFIEKYSPILESWQRELVRIVRKLAVYIRPQKESKLINEGFASTIHYYIMNRLWEKGMLTDGHMQEFLISHTNVTCQPEFDNKHYNGINPYALGFDLFIDIKRICEKPTEEDRYWFPNIVGKPWLEMWHDACKNYRDESFIQQFLSPNLIRKWHLFKIDDDADRPVFDVARIHNERGYRDIRSSLAKQYDICLLEPDIQVWDVDLKGDRTLILKHTRHNQIPISSSTAEEVLKHITRLWGYSVRLVSCDRNTNKEIKSYEIRAG